jgi:peptide/nickel transport system permease protein
MASRTLARGQVLSERTATRLPRVVGFAGVLARRKPLGFIGMLFIIGMLIVAAVPRAFAPHRPEKTGVAQRFQRYCVGPTNSFLCPSVAVSVPLVGAQHTQGSLAEPLGTDQLGRDIFSRIIFGTRVAVYVGFGAVIVSSVLSTLLGVTSGYFGGMFDSILQRFVDAIMSLPILVVLLAVPLMIGRVDLDGPLPFDHPGITFFKLLLLLGIVGGASGSRVMRAAVLGVKSAQFLEAARAFGASDLRIILRHVIPNVFGPLMVQATIALGGVILTESALSFLGFGVSDPTLPSWGNMLQLGQQVASREPLQAVWPGIAIALAVFSFNMFGDALRDLLDPRLRKASGLDSGT